VRPSFSSDLGRSGTGFSSISVTAHESALRDYLRVLDKRKWVALAGGLGCSSPSHNQQKGWPVLGFFKGGWR
jgi:hypothetical protein